MNKKGATKHRMPLHNFSVEANYRALHYTHVTAADNAGYSRHSADTPLFSKSRLSAEFHWPAPTRPWSPTARSGLNITDAGLG